MRSLRTAAMVATTAALAALAVTVTVPAIGDDGSPANADRGAGQVGGPDEATIRACLKDHGATVPDGDGRVLKQWIIGAHTPAEKEALKACGMDPEVKPILTECLKDHGANVPGGDDGQALKQWILGSHTEAETEALKACDMDVETKPTVTEQAGPCDGKSKGGAPVPGDAAKPGETKTSPAEDGI